MKIRVRNKQENYQEEMAWTDKLLASYRETFHED